MNPYMTEAKFQTAFNHWKAHLYKYTSCEELKICHGDEKFLFSSIRPHQLSNLYNAKHSFVQHKIADLGHQNPFDSFSLFKVPAHVVVMWHKPKQQKTFYMIDIDTVQGLIDDGRKSINEEEAKKYANVVGNLI